jgi:hypothetical protein
MGVQIDTGLASFLLLVIVAIAGPAALRAALRVVGSVLARLRPRRSRPEPVRVTARPIEDIASDARRLGSRFRWMPPGTSFTRFEAGRRAYDAVLAEACQALAVDHLLAVLPPGSDLDEERARVETVLDRAGLQLLLVP